MVDCVGKELSIGDKVVCADMKYADLLIGEIVGFTPKKARVLYKRSEYGEAYGVKGQKEQLKESYQIFKYEEVVHGRWEDGYAIHNGKEAYQSIDCSHCNDIFKIESHDLEYWKKRFKVCPFCGAIMDVKP